MRLLGILALVAPVAVGIFFLTDPSLTASWVDDGSRSMVAAVTAVTIGVAMAAGLSWIIVRLRFGRLVQRRRADRRRRLHGRGLRPRRRPRRPSGDRDQRHLRIARRHPRPGHHRPADRRRQPPGPAGRAVRRGRARVPLRAAAVRRIRRHRPLQGRQRHATATRPATSSSAASPRRSPRTSARATSSAATAARNSC